MADEGLVNAEVEVMLLNIQRNNEAMGQFVARVADDHRQELKPILQDIIERQDKALSVLVEDGDWRDGT